MLQVGPTEAKEALEWIREAVAAGRYLTHPHLWTRCRQRDVSLWEVKQGIRSATTCAPYAERKSTAGGTNWRVTGRTRDGETLTVGVEAFLDHLGRRALLITVF
jgi:hypothetical protein